MVQKEGTVIGSKQITNEKYNLSKSSHWKGVTKEEQKNVKREEQKNFEESVLRNAGKNEIGSWVISAEIRPLSFIKRRNCEGKSQT